MELKLHLKFPDQKTSKGRLPQLLCEPLKNHDDSIMSGVVIKRVPGLTKLGMVVRFAYRDGKLVSCQMIPANKASAMDPNDCMGTPKTLQESSKACPRGWRTVAPYCYLISNETGTWKEGQTFCSFSGAKLATVPDGFQQARVASFMNEDTWIGLNVTGTNRSFTWQDGTPYNYTSWAEKEPSYSNSFWSFSSNDEDCVSMSKSSGFNWNDDECDVKKKFLCSLPLEEAFTATKSCPKGWEGFDMSCYYFSPNKAAWKDAETDCVKMGGHLATIKDQQEQTYLISRIQDSQWIGLNDQGSEGEFLWADGTKFTFSNWEDNQPSNSTAMFGFGTENESCVEMRRNFNFNWNDESCGTKNLYICKRGVLNL